MILFFLKGNFQFWGIFQVETLFQKLWLSLYKRAELDLRSTKLLLRLESVQRMRGLTSRFFIKGFKTISRKNSIQGGVSGKHYFP